MRRDSRTRVRRRRLVVVLAVGTLLIATPVVAAQKRGFKEATTVTVVEVPVQVTLRGEPLRELTRDDFELLDNRKVQEILDFDRIDLSSIREISDDLPIAARRHFLVLFDLAFSRPEAASRARQAVAKLLLEDLHPTDLVAVATYTQARGPQMVLGFTSDRNQIRHAITTLGLVTPGERIGDALGLVIGDISADPPDSVDLAEVSGGPAGIAELIAQQARDIQVFQGKVARDQKKNQVLALISSLEVIARMMDSVQGRKHVLFLSEGFDSSVLVGIQGVTREDQERIAELSQAAQDGESWRVDTEERFGSSQALSAVNSMVEAFRRANCTIQAIDIGRLVAGRHNPNREGLFTMAKDTGGELYSGYNDLGEAMSAMLTRTSVTYVLAFQPKKLKLDGKYHRLKVRLKNGAKGVQIVHRPGYYPPKPYAELSPIERRLQGAEQLLGGPVGGAFETATLAAAFEIPGQRAYVPVLVEIDGASLADKAQGGVVALEIHAYALDERGSVRDFFARKLGLDLNGVDAAVRQKGFKYWGHFDLDSGEYRLRVLVRDDRTGSSAVAAGRFTVLSSDRRQPALLPPFFPEPFDRWIWGREEESERRPGARHPFQYDNEPFFPAARPEVRAERPARVSLMAYNLGAGALAVDCKVLDGAGQEMRAGSRLSLVRDVQGGAGLSRLPATFEVGKLEPGDYLLWVTVKNLSTGEEQTSSIPIRVV